ncbi:MAG TPA: roadblock/LC7 domain-containing protein [Gemmatimonadaceae bacterium]|nr:roadblock/LC7 domain-containing protein [Gemmatimonadaceae bacterium]
MADEITRLSEELARDPSSLVFLQLGEALRKGGQLELALKVAMRGLERHAHNADAHDLLARICVDRGELEQAFDEWDMVLRLAPNHVGAQKGMGYVLFKQGRLEEAETHLSGAASGDRTDPSISTALRMVRRLLRYARIAGNGREPGPEELEAAQRRVEEEAHYLFADILGDGEQTALLLNADGMVTAGAYVTADGTDVSQEMGAHLSGVRDDAQRTVRHLDLGAWKTVLYETDIATVAIAPAADDAMVVVAASHTMPLGFVRRVLDRCVRRATMWLTEAG